MPNSYAKMSDKARSHWNEYSKIYAKTKYKRVLVQLDKEKDADVIAYLENQGGAAKTIREILRAKVRGE